MPSLRTFCPTQDYKDFSPQFPSRSFIVLCFNFRAVIYFELTFVHGVRVQEFSGGALPGSGAQGSSEGDGAFLGF